MTLSVGMILKNEAHRLRECLDRAKPLFEQLESELIIADTGSTDDTVAIAKEYTSDVFSIPWTDNFAEARNHTLDRATGEWFMSLDADHWFEDDIQVLIDFFKSGEYRKYGCASYKMRDYNYEDGSFGKVYTVHPHLFKRTPQTRFSGAIYESANFDTPAFYLPMIVKHMSMPSEDVRKAKNKKYAAYIKKAHEKDPANLHFVRAMILFLLDDNKPEEAKKFIDMGLETVRKDVANPFFHTFYNMRVRFLRILDTPPALRELIETADEYLGRKKPSVSFIDMYFYKYEAHEKLGNHDKAAEACVEFYKLITLFYADELSINEIMVQMPLRANDSCLSIIVYNLVRYYAKKQDYASVFDWLSKVPLLSPGDIDTFFDFVKACKQLGEVGKLYTRLINLPEKDRNGDLIDRAAMLARFDVLIQESPIATTMLEPFIELYVNTTYGRLDMDKPLSSIHQAVWHLYQGELCFENRDAQGLVDHLVAAAECESRFAPFASKRANALL